MNLEGDPLVGALDFGLAVDGSTLERAFHLQHDQYVAHGYADAYPAGWRAGLHNALSATRVFVARAGERVVGTMTLIADSPLGLPMDALYPTELRELRETRGKLAEISALAIDHEYQAHGIQILLRLTRMLLLYAAQTKSDLCIAVNPHHAAFYRKVLQFKPLGGLRKYRKVHGAPAIALRFDLSIARLLMAKRRDGPRMVNAVHEFFFHPATVQAILARLVADLRQIIPLDERVEYFFALHEAWLDASEADRDYILSTGGTII
jgi:hypothetical protein